jgi:hypothetical protein
MTYKFYTNYYISNHCNKPKQTLFRKIKKLVHDRIDILKITIDMKMNPDKYYEVVYFINKIKKQQQYLF